MTLQDIKTQNHCIEKREHTPPRAAVPLHNSGGWMTMRSHAENYTIHIHISNKKLRSWVSADLTWFQFTKFHLKYLKQIPIIPSTSTKTSCLCQQNNYFCVFQKDDNWEEKKTKSSEIIMKSSARVCLFRKSREWEDYSESRNSRVDVYRRWNMKLMELMKINTWNGYKGQ